MGLDNAGKTTMMNQLNLSKIKYTTPMNLESVQVNNTEIRILDYYAGNKSQILFRHYFSDTDAVIVVIDSSDPTRFQEVNSVIMKELQQEELSNAVVLFLANKQDKKGSVMTTNMIDIFKLMTLKQTRWKIMPCASLSGDGLKEGFDWVLEELKKLK
eukprot:gene10497-3018_t